MKRPTIQHWLVLVLSILLVSCAAPPEPPKTVDSVNPTGSLNSGFTESEFDGTFGLSYFDYRDTTLQWFGARGLQGGGYTWEALVRAAFQMEPSPLVNQIELDSEGGAFNAYAESKEARAMLKQTIEKLVNDMDFRIQSLEHAKQGGYLE